MTHLPEPFAQTRSVVVLGGGTAGWLVALMLQRFTEMNHLKLRISVVEASSIPTVGVGEGTTAVFRLMLRRLGLDEAEFIRETGATLKLGIRHKGWATAADSYDAPIDDPYLLRKAAARERADLSGALHAYAITTGRPLTESHLFGHLMRGDAVPWVLDPHGEPRPQSPFDHAFHFDQARVGAWLRRKAGKVVHLDARMTGADRDPLTGDIKSLVLEGGQRIEADFFVDCSGFRRALVQGCLQGEWLSYASDLPANRAMPFWLEHDERSDIAPYTLAFAQSAGWMWAIPTQERVGCGYVYSDNFLTPEGAQREIERALGRPISPRNDIRFDAGRMKEAWIGNCLAVGLSSSFLEPLEATSIHGTIVQMMHFTETCLSSLWRHAALVTARRDYNEFVARQVDDFRDFINLHYVSNRPEPFWREVQSSFIRDANRRRIAAWRRRMPGAGDFAPLPGNLPHIQEQLHVPVLAGLGILRKPAGRAYLDSRPHLGERMRDIGPKVRKSHAESAARCMPHRRYLELVLGEALAPSASSA